MVSPIIVDENGDIQLFRSPEEAERALEPIDVRNNEYAVYDGEGYRLDLQVDGGREQLWDIHKPVGVNLGVSKTL